MHTTPKKPGCSITDRQGSLRSLTAFSFHRFAIWIHWGISSPKPLARGPVPGPLPRFALMARFSTILPFPCAFPARQNFSRKNAVHNSTLFDAKMKENPHVPGKTCAGLSHRPQDIVDNLFLKSSQSVDNLHFFRKNPPRKVLENPDFFCYHRDAVPKSYPQVFSFVHILWKVMWNSTGCPQVYVDELCISASRTRWHSYKRHAEGFQWIM